MPTIQSRSTRQPGSPENLSARARLKLRNEFFGQTIDARDLLEPLERIPGVRYLVVDTAGRYMALCRARLNEMGVREEEIIGRTRYDYMSGDLADKYVADDQWVAQNDKPLLNIVEMSMHEKGFRDWVVTNKYPLHNSRRQVVGVLCTWQSLHDRHRQMGHLGRAGKAADYVRNHLGDPICLSGIAAHVHLSERQLERVFRRVFGMTVHQFITHSRIHLAAGELIRTDQSVGNIAMMVGFNQHSTFTRTFQQVMGVSPRVYRERHVAHGIPGRE